MFPTFLSVPAAVSLGLDHSRSQTSGLANTFGGVGVGVVRGWRGGGGGRRYRSAQCVCDLRKAALCHFPSPFASSPEQTAGTNARMVGNTCENLPAPERAFERAVTVLLSVGEHADFKQTSGIERAILVAL